MTWPTVAITTTNLDAGTDSPATARADLLDAVTKTNQMIAHVSTFGATVLDDANAAAARTTLGTAASGANTDITTLAAPALGAATATTQAATDSTTKVATTAMVQSVGLHAAGITSYTATATLLASDIGKLIYYTGGSAANLTLPTAPATGSLMTITNLSAIACSVLRGGTSTLYANGQAAVTSIVLYQYASITLVYDSANWVQQASTNAASVGVDQTWQNVIGSRAKDTTYTSPSGKPIMVAVSASIAAGAGQAIVGGVAVANSNSTIALAAVFIVPPNTTYSIGTLSGTVTIVTWGELR